MKELSTENIKTDLSLREYGVYKIYLFKDNTALPVSRFLEIDKSGLIYIGAAEKTKLAYRLNCFIASMNKEKKQNNHSGGIKISKNLKLDQYASQFVLMYEVNITKDAKEKERQLLDKYVSYYGEVPPLNG